MLKPTEIALEEIYVPTKFRGTLDPAKLETIAESIIENGLQSPIQVRQGKGRYVLVTGFHRLEAMRALGEETIEALIVQARRY
ncbi:MAG: ParB N-terminal domain-containing protein [Alphaproteobacteria bacterium]|nr:ParB N-terminal domain-containing protein [Alphaproteobacteria bacterium]